MHLPCARGRNQVREPRRRYHAPAREPRAIQGPDAGTDRVGKNGTEHDIS